MGSPTAGDVHVPSAIGNKKGKNKMAGKKAMDGSGDEQAMKKLGGKVPPQFLPKQKGKGVPAATNGKQPMAAKPTAKAGKAPAVRAGGKAAVVKARAKLGGKR